MADILSCIAVIFMIAYSIAKIGDYFESKRKEEFVYALFSLFVASAAILTSIMIILDMYM